MPDLPEIRCDECREIGCECPNGYYSGGVKCPSCDHEWVATFPACAGRLECPGCGRMVLAVEAAGNA